MVWLWVVMRASALIPSYALLGEDFRWIHLAGFAIIFAGVLLISWEDARMSGDPGDVEGSIRS